MIRLRNRSIKEILGQKKLVIYGASQNLGNMIRLFSNEKIEEHIEFIVDRDENKNGTVFMIAGFIFPVISLKEFLKMRDIALHYQMIIVLEKYLDVIDILDAIPELNGMQCNVWWYPFLSGHSNRILKDKLVLPEEKEEYKIPKTIHYCWFGRKKFPVAVESCIQSWRENCPDFEILEWNENNFDVESVPYVQEAYRVGQFSFVSDYVRYDVVSHYGGFYFDTDVRLLRDISDLCHYRGFFSFEYNNLINSGSGFAAKKGDSVIMELRERYHKRHFFNETMDFNLKPCSEYETEYFKEKGIQIDDRFQIYEGFLIFPHEVFSPVNQMTAVLELTENTRGIHGFECTWLPKVLKTDWDEKKENNKAINERLVNAWKEDYGW